MPNWYESERARIRSTFSVNSREGEEEQDGPGPVQGAEGVVQYNERGSGVSGRPRGPEWILGDVVFRSKVGLWPQTKEESDW